MRHGSDGDSGGERLAAAARVLRTCVVEDHHEELDLQWAGTHSSTGTSGWRVAPPMTAAALDQHPDVLA